MTSELTPPSSPPDATAMSMCDPHWEQLKTAIRDRGLWYLVAETGESAEVRLKNPTPANFDPLLSAHNEIFYYVLRRWGPTPGCPICYVGKIHENEPQCGDKYCKGTPTLAKNWITGAANESYNYAVEHKLLKKLS